MAPKNKNRNYAQEERLNDTPAQRKAQAARMRARRLMEKEDRVKKHDGKEVDHKRFIGGKNGKIDNSRSNLRVVSAKTNRSKQPKRK